MRQVYDFDRLVVLSDRSCPVGGAEILALACAQQIADWGVPVTFIAGDTGVDCPLDPSQIEIIPLGGVAASRDASPHSGLKALYNITAKRVIESFLEKRDTTNTVYHLHNWTKILSPSTFLALHPVSSRLFISAHDFSLVCPTLAYSNFRKDGQACQLAPLGAACLATNCDRHSYLHKIWRVARSVERRAFIDLANVKSSIGIIHPDMSEYFTRGGIPQERMRVVRNPVTPYTTERVKAEENGDVFFIGRVVHEKGVDLAAEAARSVGRRLRVIGDGEMKQELMSRYPEVIFEGWRTHEQIGALITQARALLVPSRLPETFTLVAHEAMQSGVPVVAFSDVDCREAADIGGAVVVPPREASSLAAGLRRLDDDQTAARISKIAFADAARFSNTLESWRDALIGHYSELLAPSRPKTS